VLNFFRSRKKAAEPLPEAKSHPRLPPNQSRAKRWPVLHQGKGIPAIELTTWRLELNGCVERPLSLSWGELQSLPQVKIQADMHRVTSWTMLDQVWEGVAFSELMERVGPRPEAEFAMATGCDAITGDYAEHPAERYTTNVPLEYLRRGDALVATSCNGQPLTAAHGGPVRLVVPQLYAWKSAKWLCGLELMETDRLGFWERLGYHWRGEPWAEERMAEDG
jgi:DMSO/TMAO reductase YedYZ molybdopterin-dependent catalytic subunit